MSTYAQQLDVEAFIEDYTSSDPAALERLIRRCERDLDRIIYPINHSLPPTQILVIEADGGQFTLEFAGQTTAEITYPPTAASIQAQLADLDVVGLDDNGNSNATVIGVGPFTVIWTFEWAQTNYIGQGPPLLDYQIPLITINSTELTVTGTDTVFTSVQQERGRRVNPTADLNENQVMFLANGTSAQVEYRMAMGEPFFIRGQYDSVRGPDFTTQGKLPRLGPKVRVELAQSGLLWSGARAKAGWGRRGVGRGWPNY